MATTRSEPPLPASVQPRLESALVWMVVLFAGQANVFARSLDSWEMVAAPILYLGFHLFVAWKSRAGFDRSWLVVVGTFTALLLVQTWTSGVLNPRFWGVYVLMFTGSYLCLRIMGWRYFHEFESVVTKLALLSLPLWTIQMLLPGLTRNVVETLQPFPPAVTHGGFNAIVYSMQDSTHAIPRNCGFAWEPGGFASILVFAIFVNLHRNQLRWRDNPNLLVLSVALLTTQSTTGWTAAAILVVWFIARQKSWPMWLTVVAPLAIAAAFHPMMATKIAEGLQEDDKAIVTQSIDNAYEYETVYTPQRFASFRICWEEFLRNKWIGFGGNIAESTGYRERIRIVTVTGLGDILRRFGIAGMTGFVVSLLLSANLWAAGGRGAGIVLVAVVAFIGFSYAQVQQPVFMSFWMSGVFLRERIASREGCAG